MQLLFLISMRGFFIHLGKCFTRQCKNLLDGILPVHFHSLKPSALQQNIDKSLRVESKTNLFMTL